MYSVYVNRCGKICEAQQTQFPTRSVQSICRRRKIVELTIILRSYAMASAKQASAAKKNIKKAATAAKKKKTIAHLPKATRTALGKQGAKVAAQKRRSKS